MSNNFYLYLNKIMILKLSVSVVKNCSVISSLSSFVFVLFFTTGEALQGKKKSKGAFVWLFITCTHYTVSAICVGACLDGQNFYLVKTFSTLA